MGEGAGVRASLGEGFCVCLFFCVNFGEAFCESPLYDA